MEKAPETEKDSIRRGREAIERVVSNLGYTLASPPSLKDDYGPMQVFCVRLGCRLRPDQAERLGDFATRGPDGWVVKFGKIFVRSGEHTEARVYAIENGIWDVT